MTTVRNGPLIGLVVQIVLLAGLAGTVGLGPAGWLAGLAYGLVVCLALSRGLDRAGATALGPADRVTLGRALLVGAVTALVADGFAGGSVPVGPLTVLAAVALSLDAVDGYVARRTGTTSALGARFDMEIDSVLVAVLSLHVAPAVGIWVLALGGMRYAFVAAGWALPWMCRPLPPRYWRKVVAAALGVVLLVVATRLLPPALAVALPLGALLLVLESFGRDVTWLWRHRSAPPAGVPLAASEAGVPVAAGPVTGVSVTGGPGPGVPWRRDHPVPRELVAAHD